MSRDVSETREQAMYVVGRKIILGRTSTTRGPAWMKAAREAFSRN